MSNEQLSLSAPTIVTRASRLQQAQTDLLAALRHLGESDQDALVRFTGWEADEVGVRLAQLETRGLVEQTQHDTWICVKVDEVPLVSPSEGW